MMTYTILLPTTDARSVKHSRRADPTSSLLSQIAWSVGKPALLLSHPMQMMILSISYMNSSTMHIHERVLIVDNR